MRGETRRSLWAVAFLAAGCSTPPGGPILRELGVHAGKAGAVEQSIACVTLPVLIGSHVDAKKSVDGKFDVSVDATRDAALVRFETGGGELVPSVSIPAEELHAGYSQQVSVRPPGGDEYTVRLSSDCADDQTGGAGGSGAGGAGAAGSAN